MTRWLYDLGFFVFGIFSLPHFIARLRQAEDPARLVRERFGFLPQDLAPQNQRGECLWVHAVSVGEVLAVEPLLRLLLERKNDLRIVLTTVTPTGQRIAKKWENGRVRVLYFPFDMQFAVRSFFQQLKPALLLLVETEIWPNLIQEARSQGVPVVVVNGRLSDRSFKAFRRVAAIFKPLLKEIKLFLVQTAKDRERLLGLEVDPEKVKVTGNMKLDQYEINETGEGDQELLRKKWGFLSSDQILIGGSTHEGEEKILGRVFRQLQAEGIQLKLLLAPRHIERSAKLRKELEKEKLRVALASERPEPSSFTVLILDQLGELRKLYSIADVVFMGGSLVRHGGQNPIEPASFRKPIVHGPWVFNFEEIYRTLEEEGGSLRVAGGEEALLFVLKRVLMSEREKKHLGESAYEVLRKLRGATEKNFNFIEPLIGKSPSLLRVH